MSKTLLIIDDSKSILSVISYIFSSKYTVVKKVNGVEALDWLQEGNMPSIIVSDLDMPEMDGFTLLKHLKSSAAFEDIPLVILSNTDSSTEKVRCLRLGADDYVVKPFNPEELDARVENLVRKAERYSKV